MRLIEDETHLIFHIWKGQFSGWILKDKWVCNSFSFPHFGRFCSCRLYFCRVCGQRSHFCSVSANSLYQPNSFFPLQLPFLGRANSPFFPSIFPSFVHLCNCTLSRNRKELPQSVKEPVVKVSFRRPLEYSGVWVVCEFVHTSVVPQKLDFLSMKSSKVVVFGLWTSSWIIHVKLHNIFSNIKTWGFWLRDFSKWLRLLVIITVQVYVSVFN